MIQVDFMLDGNQHRKLEFHTPKTVQAILDDQKIDNSLVCRINKHYVSRNRVISENTALEAVTYASLDGMRIYQDTAIFILMKAFHHLYPRTLKLVVEHSIGDGVYCEIMGGHETTSRDAEQLTAEMKRIVDEGVDIEKLIMPLSEAERIFGALSRNDVIENFKYREKLTITVYRCGRFHDYYIRQLCENTSIIRKYEVVPYRDGLILRFPTRGRCCDELGEFSVPEKLFGAHQEHDKWLKILKMHNVFELNRYISEYNINEITPIEEALHEKKIAYLADSIREKKGACIVLIAGPSSSGKTTFAKRLSVQLRVNRQKPLVIGMDDYFLPRRYTPKKEDGSFDFESVYAVDLELLNEHLTKLLKGEEVELPKYSFHTGEQEPSGHFVRMGEDSVVILEGIHCLNPILTKAVPDERKFRIYISPLNQLNLDNHNRIPTTDCRKIRRIVRDSQYRGYSATETLQRWQTIREGEERNIFPFQENADAMFNSSLTYELGVLKKHAIPLLRKVAEQSPVYPEAQRLIRLLEYFKDIPDGFVPTNSILREFTYGSIFKY